MSGLCTICDLQMVKETCKSCKICCCKVCFRSHERWCNTFKDNNFHVCHVHKNQVHSYCNDCCELICAECRTTKHSRHNISPMKDAAKNIIGKIPSISSDISDKAGELKIQIQHYAQEYSIGKRLVPCIEEEERRLLTLIAGVKVKVITQIENFATFHRSNKNLLQIVDEMTAILHNLWKEDFCIMFLSRWSAVMLGLRKYETKLQEMNLLKFKETRGILLKTELGVKQYFRNKIIKDDSLSTWFYSESEVSEFETVNVPQSSVPYDISDDEFLEDGFVNIVQLQKDDGNEKSILEELKNARKEIERLKKGTDEMVRTQEKTAEGKLMMLRPLNPSEESIVHMGSRILLGVKDSLPIDSSSISDVVDFVLDHISKLNGNLASIQNVLQSEKDKLEDLTITQTETNRINKQLKHVIEEQKKNMQNEIKSRKVQRQKQEDLNDDVNNKLKELQERTRRYQLENIQTEERYQLVYKEKDDLKLRIQQAFRELNQKDKAIIDLETMNLHQKDTIIDKENVITVLRKEKDDLQTRLSSVAGEKLTKGNPTITDLGDPNRPMKIGEKYGELYDNEWTDAMENIKTVKQYYPGLKDSEIEEIIIHHLHTLLKCCYYDCLERADQQIRSLGKAFAETMCMNKTSDEDIVNLPVCKEASAFRKERSKEFANVLYQNKSLCKNTIDDWKYKYKNVNVMQLLLTSEFFEKCVHLCWSMVIQDPKMYLDDDLTPDTPFDKNTYKEFVRSGDRVAYVVWPALFLDKDGPLLFKGVVQAYWEKS